MDTYGGDLAYVSLKYARRFEVHWQTIPSHLRALVHKEGGPMSRRKGLARVARQLSRANASARNYLTIRRHSQRVLVQIKMRSGGPCIGRG